MFKGLGFLTKDHLTYALAAVLTCFVITSFWSEEYFCERTFEFESGSIIHGFGVKTRGGALIGFSYSEIRFLNKNIVKY